MEITQSLYDEMIKNSSNIDGISVETSPFRASFRHHGRGEAGDNGHTFSSQHVLSPASPLNAQSTKNTIKEMIFDDVVMMLSWFVSKSGWRLLTHCMMR
jgi:hypothetical protein